jgi:Uma2 family endonuclease
MIDVVRGEGKVSCTDKLRHHQSAEQLMGMPASSASTRRYTLEEFERLRDAAPPGPRYEFLDGEILVSPSPNRVHQRIVVRLTVLLEPYVRANGVGELVVSPFDVRFGERRVFQPDLLVASPEDVRAGRKDAARELVLAVEIVSPGSARHDRVRKRPVYQEERVDELWLIDPESELVERWTPAADRPEVLTEGLVWSPAGTSETLSIDLVALFTEAKR